MEFSVFRDISKNLNAEVTAFQQRGNFFVCSYVWNFYEDYVVNNNWLEKQISFSSMHFLDSIGHSHELFCSFIFTIPYTISLGTIESHEYRLHSTLAELCPGIGSWGQTMPFSHWPSSLKAIL